MNPQTPPKTADPLTGYFSSVMLALLISHTLASTLVDFAAGHFYLPLAELWRYNVASGLFLGLVLADPVGAIINRVPLRNVLVKFVLGFAAGVIIQVSLVTPLAGGGLSRFVFLFIATMLMPVFYSLNRMHAHLAANGSDVATEIAHYSLWIMGWPDRALIIVTMVLSFGGFWLFSPDLQTTIIFMGAILAATTLYVIYVRIEEENPWLDMLPEDAEQLAITRIARQRLAHLTATVLPGAFLLGAAMHVALNVLLTLFPNIASELVGPVETLRTVGIVAATGLGIVFFGMLSALGFGLALVLLIGRIGHWTQSLIRDRCLRLIKVMCFRPINRATR
ncbi:MAG: hypothetical protein WBN04_01245 [Paracoccaceae bacterium]